MKALFLLPSVTAALLFSSCLIVPPFSSPVSPKMKGQVIDAATAQPVSGALVTTQRAGYVRKTRSKDDGSFEVPSASQWHFLVYLGSPGFYPTPWVFTADDRDLYLTVEKDGFRNQTQAFAADDGLGWNANVPPHVLLKVKREKK